MQTNDDSTARILVLDERVAQLQNFVSRAAFLLGEAAGFWSKNTRIGTNDPPFSRWQRDVSGWLDDTNKHDRETKETT